MNVLVVAAHPDDEVLGCGGTMARHARAGDRVTVLILGEGATSRHATREATDATVLQNLADDARRANGLLGVDPASGVRFGGLPDNRFDTLALLDVVKLVESTIADAQPAIVYTQHGGDLNIDHVVTFRAVLTATRPMAGSSVREVLAYEVASSSEWAFNQFAPAFRPSVFIDISDHLEQKVSAMAAYTSEARPWPHPRSPEALTAIARRHGSTVGVHAAEAFQPVRIIR
ncbi:MAG: PIG-L deacetylase family protein [Planctomycetota bacterium]